MTSPLAFMGEGEQGRRDTAAVLSTEDKGGPHHRPAAGAAARAQGVEAAVSTRRAGSRIPYPGRKARTPEQRASLGPVSGA